MYRKAAGLFLVVLLILGGVFIALERGPPLGQSARSPLDDEGAFSRWLEDDPKRAAEFSEFERYLADAGVGGVVPAWQLVRIDAFYAGKCDVEPFTIPPRRLWPNILPALRLVRDHIKPQLGPVDVLSSYRTPEVNACALGAGRSKHLDFSAVDLQTNDRQQGEALYRQLCEIHTSVGPRRRMGLGAYFDVDDPNYAGGRFHIDGEGYRSWGRDYRAASSPCRTFNSVASPS